MSARSSSASPSRGRLPAFFGLLDLAIIVILLILFVDIFLHTAELSFIATTQPVFAPASGSADVPVAASTITVPGVSSFVVPTAFPTTVYSSYYVQPGSTNEPQPVITDPVRNLTYPLNLTDPKNIPDGSDDPVLFPEPVANLTEIEINTLVAAAHAEVHGIIADPKSSNCSRCLAALAVGQKVARMAPAALPAALVTLCKQSQFASNSTCETHYAAGSYGAVWAQVLAAADLDGSDGRYICASLSTTFCDHPVVNPVQAVFPKARPAQTTAPKRSGKRVKVLHLSDLHLDARYEAGSEAECSNSMCCRASASNQASITTPAPLFGYYRCDSPYFLAVAAMQAIGPLTGTSPENPLALALYTGDLVAHDPQNHMSESYVEYVESSLWQLFKAYIRAPIYCALGNHDTSPNNLEAPHALDGDGPLGRQFSWNHDHVSALWRHYDWLDDSAADAAALHYGAYSVRHPLGLRILTINTDLYYRANAFSFLHADDPDFSGIFAFLIDELQKAEDAGERVWLVGHVLSGWDGSNPLPSSADLLYQIIDRYSPHVIAGVFFGHTHEDQAFVYYANNGTRQTADEAINSAWVGPSITPLTNLNPGFRLYEVDTGSWEVFDAYTFYADVSDFGHLNGSGPVFQFEYSTRAAYGPAAAWPDDAPLNATFWHRVTEAMEADPTHALVSLFNTYQGKSSIRSPNCTSDACAAAKICYMRSGSAALGRQCPQGFASVQSRFTGHNF